MSRKVERGRVVGRQQGRPAVAVVVDGKDEKWYLAQAKEYYCGQKPALRSVKLKPEMPQDKKVQELFEYAKGKLKEEYTHVVLVMDFDGPLNKPAEFEQFKKYCKYYLLAKDNNLKSSEKKVYGWMENLTLIINNPCLEYWFLLHFAKGNVTKFYPAYRPELEHDVKALPGFDQYDKKEKYYNDNPDIFLRLGGLEGLQHARSFTQIFRLDTCQSQGVSEMGMLFDFFDKL